MVKKIDTPPEEELVDRGDADRDGLWDEQAALDLIFLILSFERGGPILRGLCLPPILLIFLPEEELLDRGDADRDALWDELAALDLVFLILSFERGGPILRGLDLPPILLIFLPEEALVVTGDADRDAMSDELAALDLIFFFLSFARGRPVLRGLSLPPIFLIFLLFPFDEDEAVGEVLRKGPPGLSLPFDRDDAAFFLALVFLLISLLNSSSE